uniref:Aquaporin n=1 Tax=Strongyloides papillosus TaxID=174720 RepID=A0A0N5CD89_STREA
MSKSNGWEDSLSLHSTVSLNKKYTLINQALAEFVGCLIFVFIGSISALNGNIVSVAFAHGLTIFAGVSAFGEISGGHLNPAVSLSLALSGKFPFLHLLAFWPAQLLGGFTGSVLLQAVLTQKQYDSIIGGATVLNLANTWWQGLITECILTFILTTVIVMTAADRKNFALAPLSIGMALSLCILSCGSISGASLNPARSLGPAAAYSIFGKNVNFDLIWNYHYIYWAGPFAGSVITASLYRLFFSSQYDVRIV